MIKRYFHILLLVSAFLIPGCVNPIEPRSDGTMVLTVRCDKSLLTKADPTDVPGEKRFNENLISSVDFLFYPGENPAPYADAVHHVRKALSEDIMQEGEWWATINLVIMQDDIERIFTEANHYKATIYALVNFDEAFIGPLSATSHNDLAGTRITTDFAENENNYIQPHFLMDGETVVTYDENRMPSVTGEILVTRFASKLSVAVHVENRVTLYHRETVEHPTGTEEVWTPVLHTMRLYLVDGVKTVLLSRSGHLPPDLETIDANPNYFDYGADDERREKRRPFLKDDGSVYLPTETAPDGRVYYNTYPMYSYPRQWTSDVPPDYSSIHYDQHPNGRPPEQPYFTLEMDWRREQTADYAYDRRKYYYKIPMPFDEFERNHWYGFYLDVGILGSETDEGQVILEPTCYLLDWQNKSSIISRHAVINKARYLSLEKQRWEINNQTTLSIPFMSSHDVVVVDGSVKATRPYYGEINSEHPLGSYHQEMHAWIKRDSDGKYYLDYNDQPVGNEAYEPSEWLSNTSTSIELNHSLQNEYEQDGFDYSPYTIELDIVHEDLAKDPSTYTYGQYLRHITIVQYPAIYIEAIRNSDTRIKLVDGESTSASNPYGYPPSPRPWNDRSGQTFPWGYVYVNGGRFVRQYREKTREPFFQLSEGSRREYQWQTVWYTGGSKDMFDIHVTVLPQSSSFIIGDPRTSAINNLDDPQKYPNVSSFSLNEASPQYDSDKSILGYTDRTGFNEATALYGDSPRTLSYYYPAESSTRTENMLAPSYRIASKFGGTEYGGNEGYNVSKEYAEYRCAGYQEDGFPAGRWRLPTKAEIHFIAQLSAKKAFERLFSNATYWSANGAITVNSANGTVSNSGANTALLRCVYDSWYWDSVDRANFSGLEEDPRHNPRYEFVWGDKAR